MALDDGLTPLLPREGKDEEIKLPQRKLTALALLLGCSVLADAGVCSFCCTGGFSAAWSRCLGKYLRLVGVMYNFSVQQSV